MTPVPLLQRFPSAAPSVHEQMNSGNHELMNPSDHEFMKKVVNA
jgi:hypothetical protein